MKKLILLLSMILILMPTTVLASDISGAQFYGAVLISNNSTAAANVSTVFTCNTTALMDLGYINSTANNTAIRTGAGADVAYMPGYGSNPWCLFVPSIGDNSYQTDILYTGGAAMNGTIRYFPGTGGMTAPDSASLELGDNFTIEQSGWVDTSAEADWVLYFNGTTDYCEKVTSVTAQSASLLTVEAWFNTDTSGALQTIVACGDWAAYNYWGLRISAADKIQFTGGNLADSAKAFDWTSTNTTSTDTWHYIMATYQSGAPPKTRVYVDGELWGGSDTGDGTAMAKPTTYLEVGCDDNAHSNKFSGYVDEVRVSETVRTASEATANWNSGVKVELADDANTMYLFHFTEGRGGIAYDETANDNDLTITGAEWYGFAAQNLIYKKDAFLTHVSGTGNITSSIAGGGSVTASGVSSGEHTIRTTQGDTTGGHIYLSSSGDYVDCGDSANLSAAAMLSIEVWMKGTNPTVNDPRKIFASKYYHSTAREWVFFTQRVGSYDQITFYIYDQSSGANRGGYVPTTDNISIWDGVAHHLAVTWDGDISNPCTGISFYIDGVSANYTDASGGAFTAIEDTAQPVYIGRQGNLTLRDWRDYIDEVRIYNRELSAAEVAQHYGGTFTDESSIVGLWHIDEGSGITVYDASGENNDGSLIGSAWSRQVNNISGQTNQALELYIDDVFQDIHRPFTVAGNSENWTFIANGSMPYMEFHKITIGGILQQHIIWENDTATFGDQSGNSHDATPTFRTSSSDADVSASLASFLPIEEADAPAYVLSEAPDLITSTPGMTGVFADTPSPSYPGREVIRQVAIAGAVPEKLPTILLFTFILIVISLAMSAVLKRYGSGSLVIKSVVIGLVMCVYVAVDIYEAWQVYFFIVMAIGIMWMSRQREAY